MLLHAIVRLAAAVSIASAGAGLAVGAARPASVLLVTFDTTRADAVGCYGGGAATPTLDRLAREGVRFELAHSPVPLTSPAHATIMTGRLPREHGVRDNALFRLPAEDTTLAEQFKTRGWRTAAVVGSVVLDRATGLDQGFDLYDDQVRVGPRDWFDWQERGASQVVDAAVALLPRLAGPFFLWVHFYDPHLPYVPPAPYREQFKDQPYTGEIAFADAQLGRLLDELRARGLDKDLLVAAVGDHGEMLGEHGEKSHGVFVYQSAIRVPLILRGPGAPAARVVREPVSLLDLAPTLLDLAGVAKLPAASGRSLAPALRGRAVKPADIEVETHYPRIAFGWAPLRALLRWPYKFVFAPRPELYDVAADPGEKVDLAGSRRALAAELARALAARLGPERDGTIAAPAADDPERVERLRSLGYAAPAAAKPRPLAESIDPKDGVRWLAALDDARWRLQYGSPREAAEILAPVVARNPENLEATLTLVHALSAFDSRRAVDAARAAVARWPDQHLAHLALARALRSGGGADAAVLRDAEREVRAALAIFPRNPDAVRGLAELLIEQGRLTEARRELAAAERGDFEDPGVAALRGAVEAELGELDAADRAFQRALRLDPRSAPALEGRAHAAYQKGDKRAAAALYQDALDKTPSARLARTLGAILLDDLGDREGARRAFQRSLELEPRGPDADRVREILAGF